MDQSVKTLISLVVTFIGVVILIGCVGFFLRVANARSTMYSVIEHVEVYGYDVKAIDEFAKSTNTEITVIPIETNNKQYRYNVQVSFNYTFAFINFKKNFKQEGQTRFVSY